MDEFDDTPEQQDVAAGSEAVRQGDILGLGGAAVPTAPGDHLESGRMSKAARRRRMSADDESGVRDTASNEGGATGIDMGSGGTGTDIE